MKYSNGKRRRRRYIDTFAKRIVFLGISCVVLGMSNDEIASLMWFRNTTVGYIYQRNKIKVSWVEGHTSNIPTLPKLG